MKILAAIANHGTGNKAFLNKLITTYQSMRFDVDIVILSNITKEVAEGVEVRVGVPSDNPWSLPFAYQQLFKERKDDYDLYIYSEDDTLLEERHIDAFIESQQHLAPNEIFGFIRREIGTDGAEYYSTVHSHYHWHKNSVRKRGEQEYAYYSNEHAALFVITKAQLAKGLESGALLTPPYAGWYDMLCTAATLPYTKLGLEKVICISDLPSATVHHLPNKYIGRLGATAEEMNLMIDALRANEYPDLPDSMLPTYSKLPNGYGSKHYHDSNNTPTSQKLNQILKPQSQILSIGCTNGALEHDLQTKGHKITAIPLDPVIGSLAEAKGINSTYCKLGDLPSIAAGIEHDTLILMDLLQLSEDQNALLKILFNSLKPSGKIYVSVPNHHYIRTIKQRIKHENEIDNIGDFRLSGIHKCTAGGTSQLLSAAGFNNIKVHRIIQPSQKPLVSIGQKLCKPLFSMGLILEGEKV